MNTYRQLLQDIATDIEIVDQRHFTHRALGTMVPARDVDDDPVRPLLAPLCRTIYLLYHVGDQAAARLFLTGGKAVSTLRDLEDFEYTQALHLANPGAGYWVPQWTVRARHEHGYVVERGGISILARPEELSLPAPEAGVEVSVRFPPENRYRSAGWYSVVGDAGGPPESGVVRLYLCLGTVKAGPVLLRAVMSELNLLAVPYGAKTVNHPEGLVRRDSFVVYLGRDDWQRHREIFERICAEHANLLRADYPRFAHPVATGLSFAEEPSSGGGGISFGEHRSLLASEGLLDAFAAGQRDVVGKLRAIESRFAKAGIDSLSPYLAGTT